MFIKTSANFFVAIAAVLSSVACLSPGRLLLGPMPPRLRTPRGDGLTPAAAAALSTLPAQPSPPPPPPLPPQPVAVEVFGECANCRKTILLKNRQLHEAHCVRNYKLCEFCGKLCELSTFDEHMEQQRGTMSILIDALAAGDAGRVRSALDHCPEIIHWRDGEREQSLLHAVAAVAADRWDMHALITAMIELGAEVNGRDSLGWTPLHAAAKAGSAGAVGTLISSGADVSASNLLGSTALEVCVGEDVRASLLMAGAELPGSRGSSRVSSCGSVAGAACNQPTVGPPAHGRRSCAQGGAAELADAFALSAGVSDPAAMATNGAVALQASATRPQSSSRHAQRLRAMVSSQDTSVQ